MSDNTAPKVTNFLIWSILVTIFCCWPLGIPAIVFSVQANKALKNGDTATAEQKSKNAKLFLILSLVGGICAIIVSVILNIAKNR